jgi:Zn-finger nucleic acid-binding protein
MARDCPECNIEMVVETVSDVQLDVCPACAGTWFDPAELRVLLTRDPLAMSVVEDKAAPAVEQKNTGPSLRRCPACKMPLEQYHYLYHSPVVLDACPDCGGFWVEDGELSRMQTWLDKTTMPLSPKEEASLAVANLAIDHHGKMQRHQKLRGLFSLLQQHRPGWAGLFP